MPRAGGVYTLPAGNPVVTLTVISSAWANTTMSDIATALTGSMPTDGSAPMTGVLRLVDGGVGAPALTWATETTSGLYRIGAGDFGFSIAGVKVLELKNAATTLTVFGVSAGNVAILGGVTIATAGNVTIAAPSSGNSVVIGSVAGGSGLTVNGAANAQALQVTGGGAAGTNFGVKISAGTNAADYALFITNGAASTQYAIINGDGSGNIGKGQPVAWNTTGNVSIPAPSAGTALTVLGLANSFSTQITGSSTASQSFGLNVSGGTNNTDLALQVTNQANSVAYLKVFGDGGVVLAAATGGDQGLGTLNATGLYINGGQLFFGAPVSASSTAAVTDVGKMINAAGNIAVNNAVFSQGHIFSIYNNTAGAITINGTITTMRLGGTATTGNRTLAARGIATVWFEGASECIVSGPGVS